MSEHDKDGNKSVKGPTSNVGEGERSLSNWQRVAQVRSGDGDKSAVLAGFGIDSAALAGGGDTASLAAVERRLAFAGEVERDTLGVHRCASIVVGPVAVAIAGVAAGVVAAAAAWLAAYAVNAAQTVNYAWTTNLTSGNTFFQDQNGYVPESVLNPAYADSGGGGGDGGGGDASA